jgi:class 3 adenylate cyclase
LAIVEQLSPEQTRLRAQLLSHLGTCAVEQGAVEQAQDSFMHSARLAQADHNAYGLAFAALGLSRVAFLRQELAQAEQHAEVAWTHVVSSNIPVDDQEGLRGLLYQLKADISLARGEVTQAVEAFAAAYACFVRTPRDSVIEMAHLLYGYAKARLANGEAQHAAHLLREALQSLDAATAESLRQEIEGMLRTRFQESWLLHSASRFIGQQYMDFLLEHSGGSEFRGNRQDVVILFCDLRGFTTTTEHFASEPEAFVTILNDYLRHMTRCIEYFGGIVCQFNGDGIMAVFSLPEPRPADDAERAVLAALLIQEELKRFSRTLRADIQWLAVGVGLHAGPVIAGLFGAPQKRLYTVNGDAANTAARLEGLTKHLGASILISDEVSRRLPSTDRFLLRPLGRYCLKGKAVAVEVMDVMGEDDGSRFTQELKEEIVHVRQALERFRQRQFAEAYVAFSALATAAGHAGNAPRAQGYQFLADTADTYGRTPLPKEGGDLSSTFADWDGTIIMLEK